MITVTAETAYRLWAETYDADPNPVLALEQRILTERMRVHRENRVLDLGTGTGRWLEYAVAQGARAYGVDLSTQMLAQAARKGLAGRLVRATLSALPFPDDFADFSVCSFVLAYLPTPELAFREMARVGTEVIVSDLHPDAVQAGWQRSFRIGGEQYEAASFRHSRKSIERSAQAAGLKLAWQLHARFGEAERQIFERAGKGAEFESACRIPAVLTSCWEHA